MQSSTLAAIRLRVLATACERQGNIAVFERVVPVAGSIHSVGTSQIHATHTKWSTISVRKPDGQMRVLRGIEAYDVVTPEITSGTSGTFYFWGLRLIAIRHSNGELTDAIAPAVIAWKLRIYLMSFLAAFIFIGIPILIAMIVAGPSVKRIRRNVLEHARSLGAKA